VFCPTASRGRFRTRVTMRHRPSGNVSGKAPTTSRQASTRITSSEKTSPGVTSHQETSQERRPNFRTGVNTLHLFKKDVAKRHHPSGNPSGKASPFQDRRHLGSPRQTRLLQTRRHLASPRQTRRHQARTLTGHGIARPRTSPGCGTTHGVQNPQKRRNDYFPLFSHRNSPSFLQPPSTRMYTCMLRSSISPASLLITHQTGCYPLSSSGEGIGTSNPSL
jgi:hypothetical protein